MLNQVILLTTLLFVPLFNQKDSINTKPLPGSLKKIVEQIIKQPEISKDYEIEIDGLLVDDTKTKVGKDFYDLFYSSWEAPSGAKNYTITICEKPFRPSSTMIEVSINDTPVYQSVLQPRLEIVQELALNAVETTQGYLVNYEEMMRQLNGADLTGSGIF